MIRYYDGPHNLYYRVILLSILGYSHSLLIRFDVLDPALRRCVCSDLRPINLAFLLTNTFLCRVGPQIEYRRLFGATAWKCWQPTTIHATNWFPFFSRPHRSTKFSGISSTSSMYYVIWIQPLFVYNYLSNYKNIVDFSGPKMY